jgi:hypothetical protein
VELYLHSTIRLHAVSSNDSYEQSDRLIYFNMLMRLELVIVLVTDIYVAYVVNDGKIPWIQL